MTKQELYHWFDTICCRCGNPDSIVDLLRELLKAMPGYTNENRTRLRELLPSDGVFYLTMNWLDNMKLIEHGTIIDGSWLTDKGKEIRDALIALSDDAELLDIENHLQDGRCPICQPENAAKAKQ